MSTQQQARRDQWRSGLISVERVLAFSDALIGIIMTLLVVELVAHLDELTHTAANQTIGDQDVSAWTWEHIWFFPGHAASFFVLTYLWRRHHEVFRHFDRLSRETAWLNAGFLLIICLMPLATSLVARSDFSPLALVVFFAVIALAVLFLIGILEHGARVDSLVNGTPQTLKVLRWFLGIPVAAAGLCLVLTLVVEASQHTHGLWIFVVFCISLGTTPLVIRRLLRGNEERQPPSSGLAEHFKAQRAESLDRRSPMQLFFGGADPDRMLLFTDGVYAIALTMMAFQLVPDDDHLSHEAVQAQLQDVFSFSFSDTMSFWFFATLFLVVQLLWFQHVRIFVYSGFIGGRTVWINSVHLFILVWFPVVFGLLTQAPAIAVSPWWGATAVLAAASLSLCVVAWSALVFQKKPNEEIRSNVRYVMTRAVLISIGVLVMFAPLGLFRGGLIFLLLIDPLTNALWHRKWRKHPFKIVLNDPANGLQPPLQWRGIVLVLLAMIIFTVIAWWLYGLWLIPLS